MLHLVSSNINKNETLFSTLPIENQISILSKAVKPSIYSHFEISIRDCFKILSTISLVNKEWNQLQEDSYLWKQICTIFRKAIKFDIDVAPGTIHKDIIKSYMAGIRDIKSTHIAYEIKFNKGNNLHEIKLQIDHLNKIPVLRFVVQNAIKNTSIFCNLISEGEFELLGKFLLFKPEFDVNDVTELLFFENNERAIENAFITNLMIKLQYNLSQFFSNPLHKDFLIALLTYNLITPCIGLKISHFINTGCNFNYTDSNRRNPIIDNLMETLNAIYKNGHFQIPQSIVEANSAFSFSDEKLNKHIQRKPISETDLKNFIIDLLANANLDLNIIYPAHNLFPEGNALFQFKHLGDLIPQPNAISLALDEYELLKS